MLGSATPAILSVFQSTLPRGERLDVYSFGFDRGNVSIHAPAWGATQAGAHVTVTFTVSIHAPAWGATVGVSNSFTIVFSSLIIENPRVLGVYYPRESKKNQANDDLIVIANAPGRQCANRVRRLYSEHSFWIIRLFGTNMFYASFPVTSKIIIAQAIRRRIDYLL